jgi:hypothetical protein
MRVILHGMVVDVKRSRVGMRSLKKSRQRLIASRSLMTIELSRYQSHNAESKNEHCAFKIGG